MNLFNFSNHNLDELVFEQRNKSYGAYAIRKSYPDRLNWGTFITLMPLVITMVAALIWNHFHPVPTIPPQKDIVTPKKPITQVDPVELSGGFTFILDNPTGLFEIVPDKKVPEKPRKKETIQQIVQNISGAVTSSTLQLPQVGGIGLPGGIPSSLGLGLPGGGTGTDEFKIETYVEKMPEYVGGSEEMYAYIRKNLVYPKQAIENNIQGRVVISFVIMGDGSVQMADVERGIGFGCDEEALRVVKEMPGWIAGSQNGHKVPVRLLLPIVFQTN